MWLFCVDPPESGLQERVCGVQPRGVHVSDARQEALHLVFIPEDITKKTQTLILRRTLMQTVWFTWQEARKPNRRGLPAGLHGRTASWGWRWWRVSEKTRWFYHTGLQYLDLLSSGERRMRPTCTGPGLLLYPLGYRPASWIYESDYLTCQHSERGVRCSSHSFLKSQRNYRIWLPYEFQSPGGRNWCLLTWQPASPHRVLIHNYTQSVFTSINALKQNWIPNIVCARVGLIHVNVPGNSKELWFRVSGLVSFGTV